MCACIWRTKCSDPLMLELQEARRRHQRSLHLDLQAVVSHVMWVLGTEPRNPQKQNRLLTSEWISSATDGPLTTTLIVSFRSTLAKIKLYCGWLLRHLGD